MGKYWYYFLFLVWFSYLIVSSILLFTNGFLLTRVVVEKSATCVSQLDAVCSPREDNENCTEINDSNIPKCFAAKSRVILLIIDAFRHDFALYNEHLRYPLPYENKMPFINESLTLNPKYNRLYKFIADPPTTTMQRLKALTTGSLPTFIDAGSNFASLEINEDNLLHQLILNNKNIVFLGDDTWINMYPNHFLRSYPYPSFNVWDLDTVDAGVTSNIFTELKTADWSLIVGHYLGVDHCGHRYGPNHPEMTRKLQEMNEVIKNITLHMGDDVILFVIGDHGMTATGDHGGESTDEVTAGLFVHSKVPLIEKLEQSVKQVDLIPTLAAILGIPIPYSNLGTIIPSCLPLVNYNDTNWKELALLIWANVQQMFLYIQEYSSITNTFDGDMIKEFINEYENLKNNFHNESINYEVFVKECSSYMIALKRMCEDVWIQFDSFLMTRGLILCFIPIFLVYIIVNCVPTTYLPLVFSKTFIIFIYVTTIVIAAISAVCYYMNLISNFFTSTYFFSGIAGVFSMAIILIQNWEVIALNWYEMSRKYKLIDIICRFVLLVSVCSFFSNSFVVQECYVSLFLLLTLVAISLIDVFNIMPEKMPKAINNVLSFKIKLKLLFLTAGLCFLIRFSTYYWQCREEQNCSEISSQKLNSTNRAMLIFALVCIGLAITLSRMWLRHCGNLSAFNVTVLLAQYTPTVIAVCSGGFWVLHYFPVNNRSRLSAIWQADYLAAIAYFLIILGLFVTFYKPITAFIVRRTITSDLYSQKKSIPQVFYQIKNLFHEKYDRNELPIICGLATIYSATFIISGVYILLMFALLLGNAAAPSAVLLYFSAALVLCISSIVRYEKTVDIGQLLEVPTVTLLTWAFVAIYFFYGTGHQPTFPNIIWEAAFVGTGGNFTRYTVPAALILINTFGSYIVMGFLLPMLHIAPFTIYAIVTSLANKKKEEQKDLTKGDITLFEYDNVFLASAFALSCKYISYFAIRVFVTMLAATIHCRHLMVWKIFAPKMIFEAISLFVTIPSVLLGYILLVRINGAVSKLLIGLEKGNR